jgi:hypothetical protein
MIQVAEPYVGKYFSQDYLRRKILRQTDQEIIEQDQIMKREIEDGIIPDPNQPIDPMTGVPMDPNSPPTPGMDLGKPVMEPNIDSQGNATQVDGKIAEIPKGGEI